MHKKLKLALGLVYKVYAIKVVDDDDFYKNAGTLKNGVFEIYLNVCECMNLNIYLISVSAFKCVI